MFRFIEFLQILIDFLFLSMLIGFPRRSSFAWYMIKLLSMFIDCLSFYGQFFVTYTSCNVSMYPNMHHPRMDASAQTLSRTPTHCTCIKSATARLPSADPVKPIHPSAMYPLNESRPQVRQGLSLSQASVLSCPWVKLEKKVELITSLKIE